MATDHADKRRSRKRCPFLSVFICVIRGQSNTSRGPIMRNSALTLLILATITSPLRAQSAELRTEPKRIIESEGRSLSEWIKLLKSSDPGIKTMAIQNIAHFGKDGRDAGP